MPDIILAIDQGTTSSRAIAFRHEAEAARHRARRSSASSFPSPAGWSMIRRRSGHASSPSARAALQEGEGASRSAVKAIGITNQRETVVIWNRRTGKPIHKAIVWQDRRTAPLCAELKDAGPRAAVHREDRPAARSLFLRHQDPLAARQCEGCARRRRRRANWPSAPSTASSSGGSPAARCMRRMPPTPRAPCSTTSTPASGTRACCASSTFRRACCRR